MRTKRTKMIWVADGPGAVKLVNATNWSPEEIKAKRVRRKRRPCASGDGPIIVPKAGGSDYDAERYKAVYGEREVEAIEDLKCAEARQTWHNYHVRVNPDGCLVEGPRPFGSNAERREYCRRYGFAER